MKIDLLLCCGDFQCCRNTADLDSMSVPPKYRDLHNFYEYYNGTRHVPVTTVFIGGNHESSSYLSELWLGGYVAPSMYFAGLSNVLQFGGHRIACLSGIYKSNDYNKGHFERLPFDSGTLRSIYHVRRQQVEQLMMYGAPQRNPKVSIYMSHDWPNGIDAFGDTERLLRTKPFFRDEIAQGTLGSPPAMTLLRTHKPNYWFSAHLHVKFPAIIRHEEEKKDAAQNGIEHAQNGTAHKAETKFLALDKCKPRADWLQILELQLLGPKQLCYDPHWLAILSCTTPHLSTTKQASQLLVKELFKNVSEAEQKIRGKLDKQHGYMPTDLNDTQRHYPIHLQFTPTAPAHQHGVKPPQQLNYVQNPQTVALLELLECRDPFLSHGSSNANGKQSTHSKVAMQLVPSAVVTQPTAPKNDEEIDLDDL